MSSVSITRNPSHPSPSPLDSFKFDVIGKDPELLKRMKTASAPDVDSRYPSPEPFEQARTDTPHLARPTLFQRLGPIDQTTNTALTEIAEPIQDNALLAHPTLQTHSVSQAKVVPSRHQQTTISEPTPRDSYEDRPRMHRQELTAIKSEHTAPDASISDIRIADRSHSVDGTMPQIPPLVTLGTIDADMPHASATSHHSVIRAVSISSSSTFSAPADNSTSSTNSLDLLHQSLRRRQDGLPIIQGRYDERAAALNASVAQTLESFQTADDQISVVQGEVAAIKARSFEMSQRAQLVISQAEQLFQEALTTQKRVEAVSISATKMANDVRRAKAEFTSAMEKSTRISRYVQKIIDWSAGLSNNEGPLIEDLRAQFDRHEEISTRLAELEESWNKELRQRAEDEAAAEAEEKQRLAVAEEKRRAEAKAAAEEEQRIAEEQRVAEEKRLAKRASLERAEMERREAEAQLDRERKELEERQRQKDYRARLEAVQAKQRQIRDDDAARLRAERQGGKDGREQDHKSKSESKKDLAAKLTSEEHGSQHTEESSARPPSGQLASTAPLSDHLVSQPPVMSSLSHVSPQSLATTVATMPTLVPAPTPHISVSGQASTHTSNRTTLGNGFVPAQTEAGRQVDVNVPYGSTTLRSEQQVPKSQKAPRSSGHPHSVAIKSSGNAFAQPAEKTQPFTSVPSQGESNSTYQPFEGGKTQTTLIIKQEPSSDPVLIHQRPSPSEVPQSSVVQQDLSFTTWPTASTPLLRAEELSDSFSRQSVTYDRENRQGLSAITTSTLPARPVVSPTDASLSPTEHRDHQNAPPVPRTHVARDDRVVGDGGWGGFQTNNDSTAGQAYFPPVAPLSASPDDAHPLSASQNRSRPDDRNIGRTSDSRSPPITRPLPARHSPVQEARNQARWRADHYSPPRSPPPSNPRKRSRPPQLEDDDFEPPSRTRSWVPPQYDRRPMHDDRDSRFVTRPDPRRYQRASPPPPRQVMENNYRPAQDRWDDRRFPGDHDPTRHEDYTQAHDAHRSPEYRGQRGPPLDSRLALAPSSPILAEPGHDHFNAMPASSEPSGSLLYRIGDTPEPSDAQSASYDYSHSRNSSRGNQGRRLPASRGRGGRVGRGRIPGSQVTPQERRSFATRPLGSLHDRIQ